MQEYLKIFLISLVTSVAVLFALGPVMMRLQAPEGPRSQQGGASTGTTTEQQPTTAAEITAPNLVGLDVASARERWRKQDITIIEDSQLVDNSVEPGTILSQSPVGGAPLDTKEIRVVVAAAPEQVSVPDVVGKSVAEATELLSEAGFEVPTPTREASFEPLGEVLRQDPDAGAKSETGAMVRLVVSGEPEAVPSEDVGDVEVPRVLRMKLAQAKREIEAAGLAVGKVREREDEEQSSQRVLDQSPAAGSRVAKGSSVDLVIVAPD